ncbi:hypothetical protein HAX54_033322 [Datura stramonium]|uniref:NB-ARC domain-containing protein n=1 Tax=Datura stramonium TaxID=4076 RepID=A0ABS8SDA7_DATST|nr:hypothetical protein [Datura stramonium]
MSHPLEMLQRLEKQLVSFRVSREDAHLVDTLQRIEKEYSSICVIEDKYLSLLYCFLDTLQQAEEKRGSLHMFSDYNHLIETFKEQYGTVLDSDEYWNSEEHDIESILKQVAEKSRSFLPLLEGYHFPKKSCPIDILQRIEEDQFILYEYRSKISNFLEIPRRIGEECQSFLIFFEKYLFSEESDPLETWQWIEKEWGLSSLPTEKYLSSLDGFKSLKEILSLDIILNLHVCECGIDAINKVQRLFQGAAADLVQIYSGKDHLDLANKDGIVILKFVMEYIETVADNLSDLLKLNDPNSPLMGQIEKALKELKFLNRLVTELHLQDVDSVIVDAGLLVYSLTYSEKANHDFPGKIQSMQAVIYIIIRKKILLQLNLPGIDGVGSAKFILDNREMFQSLYSNSVDSVKSQSQKVQKELKCFQAVVEQQDGLQHFVTQTNGLVCEVEYIFDSGEVAELQETNVFDLVLHNTTNAYNADTSSQFARSTSMNEEMKYTRKNVLLTILSDLIGKNAKLDKEAEKALAEMLRKNCFRYFIFIDDIWHTSAWDDLYLCFPDNNNGSRIILTTRHRDVASYATLVSDPLDLQFLSNDESWMLLKKKDQSKGTIDLSYQNGRNHLRPCFLYFGVFSEGREIKVSKLTWLWISEGFVTTQTRSLLEDIANDYLENLVGRNLITVAKKSFDGKIKACRIHDLLLEFCRKKAKQENFLESVKGDKGFDPSHVFPPKYRTPRRLSLHSQCNNLEKWCLSFSHANSSNSGRIENNMQYVFLCMENADKILKKTFKCSKLRSVSKFDGTFPAFSNLTKLEMLKISSGTIDLDQSVEVPFKIEPVDTVQFSHTSY